MQLFTDILTAFLMGYVALTNSLADGLATLFGAEDRAPVAIEEPGAEQPEVAALQPLPSQVGTSIPDLLRQSATYQQATVGAAAGLTGSTVLTPTDALVNIYCTFVTDAYIRTTTGTGFFIDPDGVVMTNAHVAQFLLLETTDEFGDAECIIRAGNPAVPRYTAELLYLPPAWIQANAGIMHEEVPMGTGERDYALLYVNSTTSGEPLPAQFPALDFKDALLPVSVKESEVVVAGYPAGELLRNGPSTDLFPRQADSSISELYTFGSNYADVFSVRGTSVGVEGSSGGPIVNADGEAIGVIVTRGDDTVDGTGSLRAITLSHINRTIEEETGFTLRENLGGNLPFRAQVFQETLSPFLLTILGRSSTSTTDN